MITSPTVREQTRIRRLAKEYFDATSSADRWAYWADECSFSDLFDRLPERAVRVAFCEMVNDWVADPGEHR